MVASLTEREVDVLWLAACGLTNKEIGRQLWITEDTVKTHLRRIYERSWTSGRAGAVLWGVLKGYIVIEETRTRPAKHAVLP